MAEISIIGSDLEKRVFQLHGATEDESVVFCKKLSRGQVLAFIPNNQGALSPWRPAPRHMAEVASSRS